MAGKNKLYELMISIGAKKESSLNKACLGASNDLASLGQTAKAAGKIAAGAMVAAATAVATLGTAALSQPYSAVLSAIFTALSISARSSRRTPRFMMNHIASSECPGFI